MNRGHAASPSRGRRAWPRWRALGLLCWRGPSSTGWLGLTFGWWRRPTFTGWLGLAFGWLGLTFTGWLGLTLAGCAATRSPTPASTAQRYLELTAGERPEAAYALLDESFRRRCDRPCFARLTASQREDARRAIAELRAGSAPRVEQLVELTLPDGSGLRLGQAPAVGADPKGAPPGGAYFFSQNPLEFYPQSTPEETVRSFARALQAQRYQALLRFVPRALAEQLTAEQLRARFEGAARAGLQAQLAALQKHWNEPFQVDGATARLPLGEGQEVRLVLEQGRWRVAQLQ